MINNECQGVVPVVKSFKHEVKYVCRDCCEGLEGPELRDCLTVEIVQKPNKRGTLKDAERQEGKDGMGKGDAERYSVGKTEERRERKTYKRNLRKCKQFINMHVSTDTH